jgi:hypothetical protein
MIEAVSISEISIFHETTQRNISEDSRLSFLVILGRGLLSDEVCLVFSNHRLVLSYTERYGVVMTYAIDNSF